MCVLLEKKFDGMLSVCVYMHKHGVCVCVWMRVPPVCAKLVNFCINLMQGCVCMWRDLCVCVWYRVNSHVSCVFVCKIVYFCSHVTHGFIHICTLLTKCIHTCDTNVYTLVRVDLCVIMDLGCCLVCMCVSIEQTCSCVGASISTYPWVHVCLCVK
jgi:hypothetical protein